MERARDGYSLTGLSCGAALSRFKDRNFASRVFSSRAVRVFMI